MYWNLSSCGPIKFSILLGDNVQNIFYILGYSLRNMRARCVYLNVSNCDYGSIIRKRNTDFHIDSIYICSFHLNEFCEFNRPKILFKNLQHIEKSNEF